MVISTAGTPDPLGHVLRALRDTWGAADRQRRDAEYRLQAAEQALKEARANADEVRRQIEAASLPLGLDPAQIMDAAAYEQASPAMMQSVSPESSGPRARYEERVQDLLADGRLATGEQLRTVRYGKEHFARVEANGFISGPEFGSRPTLSAAARALVGSHQNGWKFWSVRRDDRWLPVAELRNS